MFARAVGVVVFGLSLLCSMAAVQAAELVTIDDSATGVRLALPANLFARRGSGTYGTSWRQRDKQLLIETIRLSPGRDYREFYDALKAIEGREIRRDEFGGAGFQLEGQDADGGLFVILMNKHGSEKRGLSIVYSVRGGRALRHVVDRIVESFQPFPSGGVEPPATQIVSTGGNVDLAALNGTLWRHNRSIMKMTTTPRSDGTGGGITITYKRVRRGLRRSIGNGSRLIAVDEFDDGTTKGIGGSAWIFKRGCRPAAYSVKGHFTGPERRKLVLTGAAPRWRGCQIKGYTRNSSNARLVFTRMIPAGEARIAGRRKKPLINRYSRSASCDMRHSNVKEYLKDVKILVTGSPDTVKPFGKSTTVRWKFNRRLDQSCRLPLYLVITTKQRARFEGQGFLAIPAGPLGPFDIQYGKERTRLYFPLHLLNARSGQFKIKAYEVGDLAIKWAIVQPKSKIAHPGNKSDFELGQEFVAQSDLRLIARYTAGKPRIVVRDNFTLDQPKKIIRAKSGEFDLHVFTGFYRVLNAKTGELVLERTGVDPNFSPGARFIAAFVEGGNSRHKFSDLTRPNLEIIDLYSQSFVTGAKPLFLAWAHGDTFFLPGEAPCVGNSCSANLVVRQALVDGPPLDLSRLTNTYKSFPTGFQISIGLETGIVAVKGNPRRSRTSLRGWLRLFDPKSNSRSIHKRRRNLALNLLKTTSFMQGNDIFDPIDARNDKTLDWFAHGKRVVLSHHCIPNAAGDCSSKVRKEFVYAGLRLKHHKLPLDRNYLRNSKGSNRSRLLSVRSATRQLLDRSAPKNSGKDYLTGLLERVGVFVNGISPRTSVKSTITQIKPVWDGYLKTAERIVRSVKRIIAKQSRTTADLLRSAKEGVELGSKTSEGCITKKKLETPFTHLIKKIHALNSRQHNAWLFRTECSNGAQYNYWLWLLLGSKSNAPALIDLTSVIGANSASWGGPQTIDHSSIKFERYLVADGTWPTGRWGLIFDLQQRRVKTFIPNLESSDRFGALTITRDGQILVQANTNGQLVFYSTATGKVVLQGVETDDELIIYDENGYYVSSPEGSQFLRVKFPGISGYNFIRQFAKTLNRPNIIKSILNGSASTPKPNLTAPPRLTIKTQVSGSGGNRIAKLLYHAASLTGLQRLVIHIDGRPVREKLLTGSSSNGELSLPLPPEARWIAAIAIDSKGYESVPQGIALPGASDKAKGRLFAITVGTDIYDDPTAFDPLKGARRDASNFAFVIKEQQSSVYGNVNVTPLLDDPNLKTNLPAQIRQIVTEAGADDTIMLFVAGHGFRSDDGRFYLGIRSSSSQDIEGTSLSWQEIAAAFNGVKARVIVFLDACKSGAAGRGTNDEIVTALLQRSLPITVIAAAKGRQDSGETKLGGNFTISIIRALTLNRQKTDSNNNGAIELAELYGAIKRDVVIATEGAQTPWIARNQMVGEIPLF